MHWKTAIAIPVLLVCAGSAWAEDKYSAKLVDTAAPDEIKEPIRKLLGEKAVQFLDDKGGVICEVWFSKELPAKATADQIKNGLTYREVPESTIIGALRFPQARTDYKKQSIKAGVYILRLGFQPENGDHMGTAPNPDFCLLTPAAEDKDGGPLKTKELQEMSSKASGTSHPAVLLLFPIPLKDAGDMPKAVNKGEGHWILSIKLPVKATDEKADLGIGLTVIGVSTAA
jgi:hypothetical protein